MAPNLKRNALLPAPQALPVPQPAAFKNYQAPQPVEDSASYWSWPADVPQVDVFSTDHIVANLVQASSAATESTANPENDSYWAEEEAQPATPQHAQEAVPVNYWDEAVHVRSSSDSYWAEQQEQTTNKQPENYWDEASHARTASDLYWAEQQQQQQPYWDEASHARTASDAYWTW